MKFNQYIFILLCFIFSFISTIVQALMSTVPLNRAEINRYEKCHLDRDLENNF